MKMVKFPSFAGYLAQKQRIAGKTVPAIPLPHFLQICFNFAVFLLRKAPEKIPEGCLFWLSDALSRTFFPKKYLINSTARPLKKGRAAKYFLVT